jgi:alkylation response protein AidB-like acyl-CoA dehydrogenase
VDLTLTEDQQLVQSTAREFLAGRTGADLWKEIVELGWTGLTVPEAHGGIGADFLDACLVAEELGRAGAATPFAATVATAMTIARSATEEQQQRWLPAIVAGAAVAHADLTATSSGDGHLVTGRAEFVPFAATADLLLITAGPVTALIDRDTPGITSQRLDVIGNEPVDAVTFDAVPVPADQSFAADTATGYATVLTCAEMVGGAQAVLDLTVDYAGQRRQFGRPIGSFQAVQHHCANMAIDVLAARFATYEAAWRLGSGSDASMSDASMEVSTAKAVASDAYQRVCALGHQVHGAIGFTAEHHLHRYLRHATAAALTYGDADFHLDHLATQLGL